MATTAEIAAWSAALTLIKTGFNATATSVNAGSAAILPFAAQFQPLIGKFNDVVTSQNALGPEILEAIRQIGLLIPSDPVIPPAGPTLTVAPATVAAGQSVTVTVAGFSPRSASDWIGLYVIGAAHTAFISWVRLPAVANSVPFVIPGSLVAGTYQFRLFPLNGYTLTATSNALAVTQSAPPPPVVIPSTNFGTVLATTNNPPAIDPASKMTIVRSVKVGTRTGFLADGNEIYERDGSLAWVIRPTTGVKPPPNTVFTGMADDYYGWCGADVIAQGAANPPLIGKFYRCKRSTWIWEELPVVFPGVIAMLSLASNILIPDPERNQLCLLLGSASEFWTLKPDTLEITKKPTTANGFWFTTAVVIPGAGKIHMFWEGIRTIDIVTGALTTEPALMENGAPHVANKPENGGVVHVPAENAIYHGTQAPGGLFGRFSLTTRKFSNVDAVSWQQSCLLLDGTRLENFGGFTNPPLTVRVFDLPVPPLGGGNAPVVIVEPPIVIVTGPLPTVQGTLTSFELPADYHAPFGRGFESKHVNMADAPGDYIYIQGGDYDQGSAMDGTWRIHKTTGVFEKIAGVPVFPDTVAPHALQDGALMQWRPSTGRIFTSGGFGSYEGGFGSTDLTKYPILNFALGTFELDTATLKWLQDKTGLFSSRNESTGSRFGGILDPVNDHIVLLCDASSGYAARRWDLNTKTRLPDIPYTIKPLSSSPKGVVTYFDQSRQEILGRWVYVLGYATDGDLLLVPRFFRFHLDEKRIEELPAPPFAGYPMGGTRLAASNGKIVWIRTIEPNGTILGFYIYDPVTKVWSEDKQRPIVGNFLCNSVASLLDGRMVFGGASLGDLRQDHIYFYKAA